MGALNRRTFLAGAGAVAALAVAPAATGPARAAKAPRVAYAVGTPGEPDWQKVMARSAEEARQIWASELGFSECCGAQPNEDGDVCPDARGFVCDECSAAAGAEAQRMPAWDNQGGEHGTDALWLAAGFDVTCGRCGDVADPNDGTRVIGDRAVCGLCLLPDDLAVAPSDTPEGR